MFCLREKQSRVINSECSSWWMIGVGNFCCQFGIREKKFLIVTDQHAVSVRPTSIQSGRSMALSAMVVECEWFICLFTYFNASGFVRCTGLV